MPGATAARWQPRWQRGRLTLGTRVLGVAGCLLLAGGLRRYVFDVDRPEHWMRIARDSSYDISIDTTRVRQLYAGIYDVWFRTDHAVTHFYREAAFNREEVESWIRCNALSYKIASVDRSIRGGHPVVRPRNDERDIREQPWHAVEAGTIEALAAQATCNAARRVVATQD